MGPKKANPYELTTKPLTSADPLYGLSLILTPVIVFSTLHNYLKQYFTNFDSNSSINNLRLGPYLLLFMPSYTSHLSFYSSHRGLASIPWTLMPRGLCTRCPFCPQCSSLGYLTAHSLTSFRAFKCHLPHGAFLVILFIISPLMETLHPTMSLISFSL